MEERDTPAWKFFKKHFAYFVNKDVQNLVANDYTPDAELVTVDFAVKGADALRQTFTAYIDAMGDMSLVSTEKFNSTDDAIMLEATVQTSKAGLRKVYDIFVMRDGKISHHFTGLRA